MIGKISIKFKKSAEEVAEVLSSKNITLRIKAAFGFETEIDAEWQGLENLNKFKFIPATFGPVVPWKGSCALKNSNIKGKSELKITIWPPKFFIVIISLMFASAVLSIFLKDNHSPSAISNIGSLLILVFMFSAVIGLWTIIIQSSANKIKREIIRNLKEMS